MKKGRKLTWKTYIQSSTYLPITNNDAFYCLHDVFSTEQSVNRSISFVFGSKINTTITTQNIVGQELQLLTRTEHLDMISAEDSVTLQL
jgi:hypothetical protein